MCNARQGHLRGDDCDDEDDEYLGDDDDDDEDGDGDGVPHTCAMLDKVIFLVIIVMMMMMLKIMTHTCAMAIFILVLFCFPSWRSHLYSCHHCQSSNFSSFQI